MKRACLMRGLLAVAVAAAIGIGEVNAACDRCQPSPQTNSPPPFIPPSHRDNSVWYALGGVAAPIIGLAITLQFYPETGAAITRRERTLPPRQPLNAELPTLPGIGGGGGQRGGAGGTGAGGTGGGGTGGGAGAGPGAQLRAGFNLPPAGAPYVLDEVIADSNASAQEIDAIAAQFNMTRRQTTFLPLLGRTLHLLHIDDGDAVTAKIPQLASISQMAGAQANFIFRHAQTDQEPINPEQYAPQKLNLIEAHRLARGDRVLVAVIDSEVDASHPDLAGAITANFEAVGDTEPPHSHGTAMAGAIAARRNMLGTAPGVRLLTVHAFRGRADAEGTTYAILKGLDWAAAQGARVINMSFAGPSDPRLREALAKANAKGIVLVAAAGNAGPTSPPLFPAADPNVIAVTATSADDTLFAGANRGNYIAVAAPGVNIYAPAPDNTFQLTTGTSVAAAEVSGVAALLIERNPSLTPAQVRKILMDTAKDLGPRGRDRDFGAGLVNALKALTAVRPR